MTISIRHEDEELERRIKHFLIDHSKEYPTIASFFAAALKEKIEREEQKEQPAK